MAHGKWAQWNNGTRLLFELSFLRIRMHKRNWERYFEIKENERVLLLLDNYIKVGLEGLLHLKGKTIWLK